MAESLPGHTLRVVRLSLAVSQVVFVCFFVTGFYWVLLGFYLVDRECGIDSFSLIFFCTSFSLLYLEEHPRAICIKKKEKKKEKIKQPRGWQFARDFVSFFFCPHFWIFLLKKKNGNRPRFPTIFSPFFFVYSIVFHRGHLNENGWNAKEKGDDGFVKSEKKTAKKVFFCVCVFFFGDFLLMDSVFFYKNGFFN